MSPFSWELQRMKETRMLIGVLLPPTTWVTADWAFSWGNMEKPYPWDVIRLSGLPFGEARTQAAYQCINGGYQFLMFLDSDILAPANTIPKLMSHRLPIVSGLYCQKFPTWLGMESAYLPACFRLAQQPDGTTTKEAITNYVPGSLIEADFLPAGCLLIHRSVFERFLQAGIKRFFQWTLHADADPPGSGMSEDFFFSFTAKQLGYRPVIDTSISCHHEANALIKDSKLVPKI